MSDSEKILINKMDYKSGYGLRRICIEALYSAKEYDHCVSYEWHKTAEDSDKFTEQQKVADGLILSALSDSAFRIVSLVVVPSNIIKYDETRHEISLQ